MIALQVRTQRNAAGFISEVIDQKNQSILYNQGSGGQLLGVTDHAGIDTFFDYANGLYPNFATGIRNELNVTVARQFYDSE